MQDWTNVTGSLSQATRCSPLECSSASLLLFIKNVISFTKNTEYHWTRICLERQMKLKTINSTCATHDSEAYNAHNKQCIAIRQKDLRLYFTIWKRRIGFMKRLPTLEKTWF